MEIYQAIILGLVEGLTEFLPVSSTFHLIFASQLMQLESSDFLKFFEVFIQAGAILAVLFLYGKELLVNRRLQIALILSFIPTAVVGFLLHSVIKNVFFENNILMLSAFFLLGVIFIFFEKLHQSKTNNLDQLQWWQALLVGTAQALAVIPGVSRSGAVILCMLLLGHNRATAAKYSFLLALPTICSAAALDLWKMQGQIGFARGEVTVLIIGSITAFIASLVILRWFINFLSKHSLAAFGYYRLIFGSLLLALL